MATVAAALALLIATGAWELWYALPRPARARIPALVEAAAILPFVVAAPFLAARLAGKLNWVAIGFGALLTAWILIFAAFMVIGGWSMSTFTAALISSVALALPSGGRGWLLLRLAVVVAAIGAAALQELTGIVWPNAGLLIGTVLLALTSRAPSRPADVSNGQA